VTDQPPVDWTLTTRDGARRETLRRWAALPLEDIVAALEEMQELNEQLRATDGDFPGRRRRVGAAHASGSQRPAPDTGAAVEEQPVGDGVKREIEGS